MRRLWIIIVPVALAVLVVVFVSRRAEEGLPGKFRVVVSIPPQAYFVERVGGEYVKVQVLVGPGQSPHTFEPTPRQATGLARAHLYFTIGVPFEERLLEKITASGGGVRVVDTCKGIKLRSMSADEPVHHEGEHEHESGAGRPDPHTWLSPRLAKIQAANICEGLMAVDPRHAATYERNLKALQADLDEVDARIAEALAPLKGRKFFVFHPAFGYFADAYGLKQVPVEIEGKSPGARQLAVLIEKARQEGVRVIFVQPQFSPRGAQAVAEAIGGAVVPIDPLARDYLKNLEHIAQQIKRALSDVQPHGKETR